MTIATDSASNERPSLAADATTADGDTDGDGNGDMAPLEAVMAMTETRKCVSIELGLLWAGCYCCGCCWCVLQPRENFTVNFEENDKCEPHFLRRLSWPEVMQVAAADQLAEWANSPPVNEQRQQPTFYFDWFSSLGFFCDLMGYDVLGGQWPLLASWGVVRSGGGLAKNSQRRQSESAAAAAAHANFGSFAVAVAVGVIFQLFLTMLEGGGKKKILLLCFLHFKIRLHMACSPARILAV